MQIHSPAALSLPTRASDALFNFKPPKQLNRPATFGTARARGLAAKSGSLRSIQSKQRGMLARCARTKGINGKVCRYRGYVESKRQPGWYWCARGPQHAHAHQSRPGLTALTLALSRLPHFPIGSFVPSISPVRPAHDDELGSFPDRLTSLPSATAKCTPPPFCLCSTALRSRGPETAKIVKNSSCAPRPPKKKAAHAIGKLRLRAPLRLRCSWWQVWLTLRVWASAICQTRSPSQCWSDTSPKDSAPASRSRPFP